MTYEWVQVTSVPDWAIQNYACNSGVAISKGQLLALLDEATVGAHSAAAQAIAGVAMMDKKSNDGSTRVAVANYGRFEAKASGAITVGFPIEAAAQANTLNQSNTTSGAFSIGYALGTATADETINVMLRL